jgi:hypothetical protein
LGDGGNGGREFPETLFGGRLTETAAPSPAWPRGGEEPGALRIDEPLATLRAVARGDLKAVSPAGRGTRKQDQP